MQTPGISISLVKVDLGRLVPDLMEKFWSLFGKDGKSKEFGGWLELKFTAALNEAHYVQAVAIGHPISIVQIYQPIRLLTGGRLMNVGGKIEELPKSLSAIDFVRDPFDAVLMAGPGWGKTTSLKVLFIAAGVFRKHLPILLTLRKPEAVDDLEKLVKSLTSISTYRGQPMLLLADGYDEVSKDKQKRISAAIEQYLALRCGPVLLSCRSHYIVYELNLSRINLAPFSQGDQLRFVKAYSTALGRPVDAERLIADLRKRGLADILKHPLLLSLVCVVKSGQPETSISRSVTRLIQRALDTLAFR